MQQWVSQMVSNTPAAEADLWCKQVETNLMRCRIRRQQTRECVAWRSGLHKQDTPCRALHTADTSNAAAVVCGLLVAAAAGTLQTSMAPVVI